MELTKYDLACRALAEARTVDDVLEFKNRLDAFKEYHRRAGNFEVVVNAIELVARAQRRLGEMLDEMKDLGQLRVGNPGFANGKTTQPLDRKTLKELEITKYLSMQCQKLASFPLDRFERYIATWREKALEDEKIIAFDPFAKNKERSERRAAREQALGKLQLALPKRKYGVILADPEWKFEPWSRETGMARAAENHYPTSQLEVIKSRNVASIAADDCALFLWSTQPCLSQAFEVLKAWGFEYRTHWIWAKDRIGMGYWNRNKHEVLLLGIRGEVPCPAPGEQWDSLIESPRRGHSEKPELFLEMVESYFPTLPKIELNRRGEARKGWSSWGNETNDRMASDNDRARLRGIC